VKDKKKFASFIYEIIALSFERINGVCRFTTQNCRAQYILFYSYITVC